MTQESVLANYKLFIKSHIHCHHIWNSLVLASPSEMTVTLQARWRDCQMGQIKCEPPQQQVCLLWCASHKFTSQCCFQLFPSCVTQAKAGRRFFPSTSINHMVWVKKEVGKLRQKTGCSIRGIRFFWFWFLNFLCLNVVSCKIPCFFLPFLHTFK